MKKLILPSIISGILSLAACSGDEKVSLSLGVPGAGNAAALTMANGLTSQSNSSGQLEISDGSNTLIVTSAELAIERIRFKGEDNGSCPASDGEDENDDCENFTVGAQILALPLDGSVETIVAADVKEGTYNRIEFKIHKLNSSDDEGVIADRPDFEDAAIRVAGTYNGNSFVYLWREDVEQKIRLEPPLVVNSDGASVNATLSVDVVSWFAAGGVLVDPASANEGGSNKDLVKENIKDSFRGFRDHDHDGVEHDDDDDHFDDN